MQFYSQRAYRLKGGAYDTSVWLTGNGVRAQRLCFVVSWSQLSPTHCTCNRRPQLAVTSYVVVVKLTMDERRAERLQILADLLNNFLHNFFSASFLVEELHDKSYFNSTPYASSYMYSLPRGSPFEIAPQRRNGRATRTASSRCFDGRSTRRCKTRRPCQQTPPPPQQTTPKPLLITHGWCNIVFTRYSTNFSIVIFSGSFCKQHWSSNKCMLPPWTATTACMLVKNISQ